MDYHVVSPEDCKKNKNCINAALSKYDYVKLSPGTYNISKSLS